MISLGRFPWLVLQDVGQYSSTSRRNISRITSRSGVGLVLNTIGYMWYQSPLSSYKCMACVPSHSDLSQVTPRIRKQNEIYEYRPGNVMDSTRRLEYRLELMPSSIIDKYLD